MKKIFAGLFCFLVFLCPLYSQPLTWDDARALAQKNNPSLKENRSRIESSRAGINQARSAFLPQLTGSGSYAKSNTATSLESVATGSGTKDEYSFSLSAQQSLFSGFGDKANLDFSTVQVALAEEEYREAESQIFYEVKTAFISVLYAKKEIELLKQILARKTENRKMIELRYEGGRESRGTFMRSIAQEEEAKFEVKKAERVYRLSLKDIYRLIGKEESVLEEIAGEFEMEEVESPANFFSLVLEHPTYRKNKLALKGARAQLAKARSSFFPTVSLSGAGRKRGSDFPPESDSWSVGATLSYPLFSGGKDYFNTAQFKWEEKRISSQLERIQRELEFNLESSYNALLNERDNLEVRKQFLKAAQERAVVARVQYGQGLVTYQDWDIIETDFTDSQKQTLQSLQNAVLARAVWIKAQGGENY